MLWHWRRRVRRRGPSNELCTWIECRRGDGPALGMGSGASFKLTRSRPRRGCATRNHICSFLSPMCLAFFQLQALNTKPDKLAELQEQGRRHLEFARTPAELQIERGGRVLFASLGGDIVE